MVGRACSCSNLLEEGLWASPWPMGFLCGWGKTRAAKEDKERGTGSDSPVEFFFIS